MAFYAYYPAGSGAAVNPSIGTNGGLAPTSSTEVAGVGPDGNLHPIATDNSGRIVTVADPTSVQHVIVDSSALPTGAATQTTLSTVSTTLGSILLDMTNGTQITQVTGTVPLPTGASTSALQTTGNTSLASIDSKLTSPLAVTGPLTDTQLRATAVPVSGAFFQATQPISAAALPLPAGAATETTLAAMSAKLPATLGQKTSAASLAVTIASDQSAIPSAKGRSLANAPTVTTYATPVTSGAYVTIVASTTSAINLVEIFDSSGVAIFFAVGAAASEVNQFVIYPGGNGQVPIAIPAGSRISYKAVSTSASGASAYNVLNLYS